MKKGASISGGEAVRDPVSAAAEDRLEDITLRARLQKSLGRFFFWNAGEKLLFMAVFGQIAALGQGLALPIWIVTLEGTERINEAVAWEGVRASFAIFALNTALFLAGLWARKRDISETRLLAPVLVIAQLEVLYYLYLYGLFSGALLPTAVTLALGRLVADRKLGPLVLGLHAGGIVSVTGLFSAGLIPYAPLFQTDMGYIYRAPVAHWSSAAVCVVVFSIVYFVLDYALLRLRRAIDDLGYAQEELRFSNLGLEFRVRERTAQLTEEIAERERLQERLLRSEKLEALGRLTGGVAHDLNNFLTAINGFAELLLATAPSDSPGHRYAKRIGEVGQRAVSVTQQLLAFGRKQVLQPQVVDLGTVVTGMEELLRQLLREDIELKIERVEDLGKVRVDPVQMEQVILNLVVNARDAMPRGGRLFLRVENVRLWESDLRKHPGAKPGPWTRLTVEDTGTGMNKETMDRIFEPFFTTKGVGEGTGLGLSTVFGIVTQSGGFISVDSELDKGSRFHVHLPQLGENSETISVGCIPSDTASLRGSGTVLLAEDDGTHSFAPNQVAPVIISDAPAASTVSVPSRSARGMPRPAR